MSVPSLIPFVKMHGLGNDFILIENKFLTNLMPYLSQLASRKHGLSIKNATNIDNTATEVDKNIIGADQIIFYQHLIKNPLNLVEIRIFNQDASEATACGNGFRCLGKYFWQYNGWGITTVLVKKTLKHYTVERVEDVNKKLNINDDEYNVSMGEVTAEDYNPELAESIMENLKQNNLSSDLQDKINNNIKLSRYVYAPNPHLVLFLEEELTQDEMVAIGKILEPAKFYEDKPDGQNINFTAINDEHNITLRTWERGTGLTQACGTGAIASLIASADNYKISKLHSAKINHTAIIHVLGGKLQITREHNNIVFMQGSANLVFSGEFDTSIYSS